MHAAIVSTACCQCERHRKSVNDVCFTPSSCCTVGPVSQRIFNVPSSVTPSKTCGGAGGERRRGVVKEGGWVDKNTQSFSH